MKILILINNDEGLYKFRKELVERILFEGHQVFLSLPFGEQIQQFTKLGCQYIETRIDRRGVNPFKDIMLIAHYFIMSKKIKPDIVLTYTIKPNIYGGIVCRVIGIPYLANVTGLGSAIENEHFTKKFILKLYELGIKKARIVFFQNKANMNYFCKHSHIKKNTKLIPGSGVNMITHPFEEYPNETNKLRFLFLGRIMKEKGVNELLLAATNIKAAFPNVVFDIVGPIEDFNKGDLEKAVNDGIVTWYGYQMETHYFIKRCHAVILPSYHEGLSNVLLESAACGRPVLSSSIPGCKETFDEGISGYGFEPKNAKALEEVIKKFILLPYSNKKKMGIAGYQKVKEQFNRQIVVDAYMQEINKL